MLQTEGVKVLRKLINTRLNRNKSKHDLLLLFLDEKTTNTMCKYTKDILSFVNTRRTLHTDMISQSKMSYENVIKTLKKKIVSKYKIEYVNKELVKEMLHYNNSKSIGDEYVYTIEKLLNFSKICLDLLKTPVILSISEWMNICTAVRNLTMGIMGYNVQHFSPTVLSCLINQSNQHSIIKVVINTPTSELPSVLCALNSLQSNDCLKLKKNWFLETENYDISQEIKENIQEFLNNFFL